MLGIFENDHFGGICYGLSSLLTFIAKNMFLIINLILPRKGKWG